MGQVHPRGHAPRGSDSRQLHRLDLGGIRGHCRQHREYEAAHPRERGSCPAGARRGRHTACQGRGQNRHHPRVPEFLRVRRQPGPRRSVCRHGRAHHAALLQHAKPGRHGLLRARQRPFRVRPRTGRRDEPRRRPGRSLARRPADVKGNDPGVDQARLLLAHAAGRAQAAPAQQIRRRAEVHRRTRRVCRRDDVPSFPAPRHRIHGARLRRGLRLRDQPRG